MHMTPVLAHKCKILHDIEQHCRICHLPALNTGSLCLLQGQTEKMI